MGLVRNLALQVLSDRPQSAPITTSVRGDFGHNQSEPSVFESNQLHICELSDFLHEFGVYSIDCSKMIGDLLKSSTSTAISQAQLVHL